jgi:hypothetical protein
LRFSPNSKVIALFHIETEIKLQDVKIQALKGELSTLTKAIEAKENELQGLGET